SSWLSPRRDWKPAAASDVRPRMSLVLQSLLPYPHSCQGTSPHQQGWDTKMAMLSWARAFAGLHSFDCGHSVFEALELKKPRTGTDAPLSEHVQDQFVLSGCRITRMRSVPDSAIHVSPLRPSI